MKNGKALIVGKRLTGYLVRNVFFYSGPEARIIVTHGVLHCCFFTPCHIFAAGGGAVGLALIIVLHNFLSFATLTKTFPFLHLFLSSSQ